MIAAAGGSSCKRADTWDRCQRWSRQGWTLKALPCPRMSPVSISKHLSAEFLDDPYPTYRALREFDPIHRMSDGSYFLTRYDDCLADYRLRLSS